jgi:hypothetical protein
VAKKLESDANKLEEKKHNTVFEERRLSEETEDEAKDNCRGELDHDNGIQVERAYRQEIISCLKKFLGLGDRRWCFG